MFLYASMILYAAGFALAAAHHVFKAKGPGALSRYALAAGFAAHSGGLAARIYSTGHAPMASMYETLAFYSWMTVLVSLVVIYRYEERHAELVTVPVAVTALAAALVNEKPGAPLQLILRTRWFETHVIASFAAYALFTLAFAGAVLYLLRRRAGADAATLKKDQDIAARAILWGFFFFSASMFAGAVWAYLAWGNYWLWEPKVIWSFIVWFYYAGAMHAYFVRQWRGAGLSVATVIGFVVVMFTYLGVSMLMKGTHSF